MHVYMFYGSVFNVFCFVDRMTVVQWFLMAAKSLGRDLLGFLHDVHIHTCKDSIQKRECPNY